MQQIENPEIHPKMMKEKMYTREVSLLKGAVVKKEGGDVLCPEVYQYHNQNVCNINLVQ